MLWQDQDAKPPLWEVMGNAPFPEAWIQSSFSLLILKRSRKHDASSVDRFLEALAVDALRRDPAADSVQQLVEAFTALHGLRKSWLGHPRAKAQEIAIELARALDRGKTADTRPVLAAAKRLAASDAVDQRVAFQFVFALANLASHPAVRFNRYDLEHDMGPRSQAMWSRADARWTSNTAPTDPPQLQDNGVLSNRFYESHLWDARAK